MGRSQRAPCKPDYEHLGRKNPFMAMLKLNFGVCFGSCFRNLFLRTVFENTDNIILVFFGFTLCYLNLMFSVLFFKKKKKESNMFYMFSLFFITKKTVFKNYNQTSSWPLYFHALLGILYYIEQEGWSYIYIYIPPFGSRKGEHEWTKKKFLDNHECLG